jgi:trimethylamine--corrinoid protein Co-methyltransferase
MKLEVLSETDILKIDEAAKAILQRTGVLVPHEHMLELFEKSGADVEKTSGRVRLPRTLIEDCLDQAGKTFTIYGRDRTKKAEFGLGKRSYNSSAGQAHWIEPTGNRRFASLPDVVEASRFGDVLPEITIVGAMADPYEIDVSYRCVEVVVTQLRTTTKPITFWFYDRSSAKYIVEILTAVAGSKEELATYPLTYPFLEPISPLRFDTKGIDLLFETSQIPLPVSIGPMAQAGLSAPGTLAATIAQETAEILAGNCIVQMINPGTPVCFGGISHAFDMRTTQIIFGGPEQALMAVALVQMGKYYDLPVYTNTGLTDSKSVDAQAGLEIASTLVTAALAGSDIFGHLGIAGADQGASLEILLLQHEIIEYVERIMQGITVNDEKLAIDLINEVGPGGTFIDQMHTAMNFREELWMPKLLDRSFWSSWEDAGCPVLSQKIKSETKELLSKYEEKPLPKEISDETEKILRAAKRNLAK